MMVNENVRWQAPIRALKAVIDEGRIGTPFIARFAFRSGFDVYAAQPYLAEGDRFIIEDLGIHILDVARFVKIGRASCREKGCKYVEISEVDLSLKKKKRNEKEQT